jgi:hypothetical protein
MSIIARIASADLYAGRYLVAADGPRDGRSTFSACWGAQARYSTVAQAAFDDLASAAALADEWRGGALIVDRQTGREVGRSRLAQARAA